MPKFFFCKLFDNFGVKKNQNFEFEDQNKNYQRTEITILESAQFYVF